MKKRTLAIILTVVLCVGLLPTSVLAEAEGETEEQEIELLSQDSAESDEEESEESEDAGLTAVQEEKQEDDTENSEETIQTLATDVGEDETEDEEEEDSAEEDEAEEDPEEEIQTLAYEGDGSGIVVIDLGNSNGLCNFADYSGYRNTKDVNGEIYLRYMTEVLDAYADDDGNLTINLPAEKDLDTTFTVVDAVGTEGDDDYLPAVTVALKNCSAYDYTLVGWVNIATGEYYKAGATAEIDLDNENVFYADWIAASYDHGSSSDENLVETVSTKDFVTVHLYDFNEIFNMYSASLVQNVSDETITETWSDSGTMYDTLMGANLENGSRLTNSFIFVNDGSTQDAGQLGYVSGQTTRNRWSGTGGYPRNAYEQWGITSPSSAPLPMLFDQSESYHGVHYVGEGDYLFQIDEDGYYYFNSDENTATYNQSDGRFYVYNGTEIVENVNFPCFLPFNDYSSSLNALDGSVDYWFGMDMEVNFYLPAAAGSGANLVDGKNMVFNFSGDDDILIFIDGELVLDMSGIHDEAFGSIDFTAGTITMGMSRDDDGTITDGTTTDFNLSSGNHDLKVYYMERGARASNLEVQFNVVPMWDYETGDVQTVTAEKVWKDSDGKTIDPKDLNADYAKSVEVGLFDALGEATDDTFGYTKNGIEYTVTYADDHEITHTYVYDSAGPTLTYTEDGTTVVDSDTNPKGQVVDSDGYVAAWLEGDTLHIRIDEQTLSDDNSWSYAWELLDVTGNYEVLELSENSNYTSEVTKKDLKSHKYWSIIGDNEIEENLSNSDFSIILTDAAQQASGTVGDTSEAKGWVIVGTTGGVKTEEVLFSQIATLTSSDQDGITSYSGTYGVTSQSEIDALGDGAIWYVEDSGNQHDDSSGGTVEGFYLYCVLNGTNYYLTADEAGNTLTTTASSSARSEFYYDSLGELRIAQEGNDRVIISTDGQVLLDVAEFEAATNDGRIYTLTEVTSSGFGATITNTVNTSSTPETITGPGPAVSNPNPDSNPNSNPGTVKTGDTNNIGLWLLLLAASGVIIGIAGVRTLRRRRKAK